MPSFLFIEKLLRSGGVKAGTCTTSQAGHHLHPISPSALHPPYEPIQVSLKEARKPKTALPAEVNTRYKLPLLSSLRSSVPFSSADSINLYPPRPRFFILSKSLKVIYFFL